MIFVIGPLFSGKKAFAMERLGCKETDLVADVQDMITADMTEEHLAALAAELAKKKVVIATEIGSGVVPMEKEERAKRELAGRLNCLLAAQAETVVRVFCGLPMVLKGEWKE